MEFRPNVVERGVRALAGYFQILLQFGNVVIALLKGYAELVKLGAELGN